MTGQEKLIMERLKEPFSPESIQWRPGATNGNRALALAYVDARAVQDRLDDVLGIGGWQSRLIPLEDGCLICELTLLISEEWITRSDVGEPNDHGGSAENKRKGAASDALKRAAVRFGIGRYLYELDKIWHDLDPKGRQLAKPYPKLPIWALPPVIPPEELHKRALLILEPEAKRGVSALARAWEVLSPAMRQACKGDLARLKGVANAASAA